MAKKIFAFDPGVRVMIQLEKYPHYVLTDEPGYNLHMFKVYASSYCHVAFIYICMYTIKVYTIKYTISACMFKYMINLYTINILSS